MINGNDEPQRQIVPAGPKPPVRPAVLLQGLLWTALGAALSSYLPYLGVFLLAYGMRELLEARRARAFVRVLAYACWFLRLHALGISYLPFRLFPCLSVLQASHGACGADGRT